jgi:hemoglobin-like flavoprotein
MLNSIVEHLHKQEVIRPAIIAMGKRHMIYGVKPFHFRMVAAAFLWMLQQQLAIDYTKEVKQAWTNCYNEVADIMIKANGQ